MGQGVWLDSDNLGPADEEREGDARDVPDPHRAAEGEAHGGERLPRLFPPVHFTERAARVQTENDTLSDEKIPADGEERRRYGGREKTGVQCVHDKTPSYPKV